MDKNDRIIDKLYLNPVIEANTHRKMLNPIHIKPQSIKRKQLSGSRSVPDLFTNVNNGNIIMQNWVTKNDIPKDIGNCLNLPIIVDRKKIKNFLENKNILKLPEGKRNLDLGKLKMKSDNNETDEMTNPVNVDKNIMGVSLTSSKFSMSHYSKKSLGITDSKFTNPSHTISNALVSKPEESKDNVNTAIQTIQVQNENNQGLVRSLSTARINSNMSMKMIQKTPIDFATFDKHLYLHDNDFLYAKRIGGPVDFVLCSYQEINQGSIHGLKNKKLILKPKEGTKGRKIPEYLTISKNTVLHYQNGIPHIYSINEWVDNFIKYKKLMNIPLFKNFKTAKLYELWRRFFKKTKRAYYTEKLKKKFHLIDLSLVKGILEIRKILKEMGYYNIFKLDIPSPVFLNKFSQIYVEGLQENNRKVDEFRKRVKNELSHACNASYRAFKKAKNITLDDNATSTENDKKEEAKDDKDPKKKSSTNNNSNNIQAFLKDAIPYAQDATRKTHYKKILRFIRLIDFLFNEAKFNLIQFSLEQLNNKFQRLYDVYINQWADSPILITMILTIQNKISYNPSIKLISTAVFDHFIQENIYAVIYKKSFIDPQEFPTYMTCFEEVFELSVDQNSNLNGRIKENKKFLATYKNIKLNFDNCFKELEKYAQGLTPILTNYLEYTSINFKKLEDTATPDSLRDLIEKFQIEDERVRKLQRKVNIGIFEFQLDYLLDTVTNAPKELLDKLFTVIPVILVKKMNSLLNEISHYMKKIQINVNDVESFIKLKKAIEECGKEKGQLENESDEIRELINIVNNHKDIKMQDYDLKLISELSGVRSNFERKFDSMTYFIDNNIKKYRGELQKTIKNFDNRIKNLIDEINDEEINNFHDDTTGPLLLLEDKSRQIEKAVENKKIYQQEEIDIEMDERELSNFENLDTLTYEYDLKIKLWNNVKEFQEKTKYWDNKQVMMLDIPEMETYVKKWNELCTVAIIDLELSNVPQELKNRVEVYEKIIPVVITIQNDNIQNIDYLRDNLKSILNIQFDFSDLLFTLNKLMNLPNLNNIYDELKTLNTQANEERRIKDIYKSINSTFISHRIPLRMRTDTEKGTKYVIYTNEMDEEYEYIEKNLVILNKEILNKYIYVIKQDFTKLISSFYKYQTFLDLYNQYQIFMLKCDGLISNSEFAKEMPLEYKKLSNDSLTKSLIKTLKDNLNLGKYIEYAHERALNSLNTLITGYETNYKSIFTYLDRKRKEYQPYYLLSNDDILELIVEKEAKEIRSKLILKIFPWITSVDPGNDNDEYVKLTTFDDETINAKYVKATRTLKDAIETIELGVTKKIKDSFKMFKREYDISLRPKSLKHPKEVVIDFIKNKDILGQAVFNCSYFYVMDTIEKGLTIEDEAFDKLFDLYHESKDERRVEYMKMLKNPNTTKAIKKILLSLIALENFVIITIENLIREDVSTINDFTYMKILNMKIENENLTLRLFNFTFDYGFEYVGIQNNFYQLNQTERTVVSFLNMMNIHKPFLIYGHHSIPKKETLNLVSKYFGKYIYYITPSTSYDVNNVNNLLYAYMRTGAWMCLTHTEMIAPNMLSAIADRIMEVYRLIKASEEEGIYNEGVDKFNITKKSFCVFFSFDIKGRIDKNSLPCRIREYYRMIGFSLINIEMYIKIILNNFVFVNVNLITRKIITCINIIKSRYGIISNNKGDNLYFHFIKLLKRYIREHIGEINKQNENLFVMKGIEQIISPFIEDKDNFHRLLLLIFDIKRESENKDNNDVPVNEELDKYITESTEIFHFTVNNYQLKIKELYTSISTPNQNHIVLLGPTLTGKTNAIISIHSISSLLNEINNDKYPLISYIKLFPHAKSSYEIFGKNDVRTAHQNNNILLSNMLSFFEDYNEKTLEEINNVYRKLCRTTKWEEKVPEVNKEEEEKKEAKREEEKKLEEQKEEEKKEENNGENAEEGNEEQAKNQEDNNVVDNTEILKKNKINAIVLDGEIDSRWMQYLTFFFDQYKQMTYSNGDREFFNEQKFIYETTTLSNASPSLITHQHIISFSYDNFSWESIAYSYIDTDTKLNANSDLKAYVRGLFENYIPTILDFITVNKIKCVSEGNAINDNFIIINLIKLFDTILPVFDFEDKKIGRKNQNATPKIELIKRQTLSVFIFSCAWIINFTTNFLIKTKIEKLISDVFKTDDLKGPIFDYYIDDNTYEFDLWSNLIQKEKYQMPPLKKNEIFYYDHLFITTIDNLPYQIIIEKFINNAMPFFLLGKQSSGKSVLLNHILNTIDTNKFKGISMQTTYKTSSSIIENYIISHMDILKKNIIGDKYDRNIIVFIDDIHLAEGTDIAVNAHEYLRSLLSSKMAYDNKINMMKYFDKTNIIVTGNYHYKLTHTSFPRFISQFNLITITTPEENYTSLYKSTLEFNFRQYIPNTSSITASQYVSALFKAKELLKSMITYSYDNLHYSISMKDIRDIVQSFHLFLFKGTSEYPEYLKKIFFYESYLVFTNKIDKKENINMFKDKLCAAYSSLFKQDKLTAKDIFNNFDNANTYIYAGDYEKEDTTTVEHIFYDKKQRLIDFIKKKINEFYKNNKNEYYKVYDFNEEMIDYLVRLLRIMENENKNLILIGNDYCGKEILLKITLFIRKIDICEIDLYQLNSSYTDFEKRTLCPIIRDAVYNNKKKFILFTYKIFNTDDNIDYILETVSNMLNSSIVIERYKDFLDDKYTLDNNEIKQRIENNISFAISIRPHCKTYTKLFIDYPFLVNKATILYIHSYEKDILSRVSFNILSTSLPQPESIAKLSNLMLDVHYYFKDLYETFGNKIMVDIPHNQILYIKLCDFISNNYSKYKKVLEDLLKTARYAKDIIGRCEEITKTLQGEIDKLTPLKENSEQLIEENRRQIGECMQEKNSIKVKRGEEERPMNFLETEKTTKENSLNEILNPFRDVLKKTSLQIHKLQEKDIVEIKNTYDNSAPGKYILSKVYECLGDSNAEWDYIKKTIDTKVMKHFIGIDITKAPENIRAITKEIVNNSDYSSGDKYQKPYRIIGLLCDYFNAMNNYFIEYHKQKELIKSIEEMKVKIENHKKVINSLMENFKVVEAKINDLEKDISQYDMNKSNYMNQIQKHVYLKREIEQFIELTRSKKEIWINKCSILEDILSHYDIYFVFISTYVTYASILDFSGRKDFTNYFYEKLDNKEINKYSFIKLIVNFFDSSNNADKDLLMSIDTYDDFIKENWIIMRKVFPNKIPYIIDYSQFARNTISQIIEYKEMKSILYTSQSNPKNEIRDKLEKALRIGSILFVENVNEKIYDYLVNIIKNNTTADHSKKYVYINNEKLELNDSFRLFLLKNSYDTKIDVDAFYNCVMINFNSHIGEIKGKLFHLVSAINNKEGYTAYKKAKNELTKESYKLFDLEQRMSKSILSFDLSGNVDKLSNIEATNEKYKSEVQLHSNTITNIEAIKEKIHEMKTELYEKYGIITENSVNVYQWINNFFILDNSYIITLKYFAEIVNNFMIYKQNVLNEVNAKINKVDSPQKNFSSESNEENEYMSSNNNNNYANNTVKTVEEYIYQKTDLKELILFIYDSISHIYLYTHRTSLLLCLMFNYLHQNDDLPIEYTQWLSYAYHIVSTQGRDLEIEHSPLKSLSDITWTMLKHINDRCSFCLAIIINDIETNTAIWNEYLSDDINVINNAKCSYMTSNFKLPNDDIDFATNAYKKFLFFYIVKPFRADVLIENTINFIRGDTFKIRNVDTTLLSSFNSLPSNKFMLLTASKEHIDINYYDKELKDYCFNSFLVNNPDAKYKEIIAKGDLSLNEIDSVVSAMKTGGIIVIKNINLVQDTFNTVLKSMEETSVDEDNNPIVKRIPYNPSFRMIMICKENSLLNGYIFPNSIFINRTEPNSKNVKYYILEILKIIPQNIYDNVLNYTNTYRKIGRKIFFTYVVLYGVLCGYRNWNIPFWFCIKDFFNAIAYIETFILQLQEDKIPSFANPENTIGFNYTSFTTLVNNIFFVNRLLYKEDITIILKIFKGFFDQKYFLNEEFYFVSKHVQIPISLLPLENNLSYEDISEIINKYTDEDFENIASILLSNNNTEEKNERQIKKINQIMSDISSTLNGKQLSSLTEERINIHNIIGLLNEIKTSIPAQLIYTIDENDVNPEEEVEINQMLFKTNKMDLYTNPLDESLLHEIQYYNEYAAKITKEIDNIIEMTKGNKQYMNYEDISKNIYYDALSKLNKKLTPTILIDGKIFKEPIEIKVWKSIIQNRMSLLKQWIKDGGLEIYHLPLFTNPKLFFNCLRMYFGRKYINEIINNPNNANAISPDMLKMKFQFTKFKSFSEIDEKTKKSLSLTQPNEIIYIDGLMINNAIIDNDKMTIQFTSTVTKNKCNVAFATFSIEKFTINEDNNMINMTEKEKSMYEDEDYDDEEEYEESPHKGNKMTVHNNEEHVDDTVLKVQIEENEKKEKDDYSLNESIAEFEFKLRNSDDNVSAILKKVKMYIDDSEDFQGIV